MSVAPTVSVGLPAFNAERYLAQTLEGLLAQTHENLEIVIVDNASTDGTGDICRAFARRDPRVSYHRNERNRGVFFNYSEAFRRSRGELFKWASCNDWCGQRFIERCAATLAERPDAVLCYPRTALFDGDLAAATPYEDNLDLPHESAVDRVVEMLRRIRLNNVLYGVVRRSALLRTRLHAPYYGSDIVLMAELALLGKFIELPEVMFYRRMSADAATKLMSARDADRYVFGDEKPAARFGAWRFELGLSRLVLHPALGMSERIRLARHFARRLYYTGSAQARQLRRARRVAA
jgi:glycosyltransferase involved in cell wall biosynthesis